jgi:hypothetical protein
MTGIQICRDPRVTQSHCKPARAAHERAEMSAFGARVLIADQGRSIVV